MSAIGYKQTCGEVGQRVRFTPDSGRNWVVEFMSANDPREKLVKPHNFVCDTLLTT